MVRFKDRTFMCMALLVWIAMALASEEKKNSMPEGSPAVAAVGTSEPVVKETPLLFGKYGFMIALLVGLIKRNSFKVLKKKFKN